MRKLSYLLLLFAVAGAAYLAGSWRAPFETVSAAVATTTAMPPPGAVVVTTTQQLLIGVSTGVVEDSTGTEAVRAFGRVTPDETRVHRLTAGLEAYITELSAVTTGSRVGKDQWLASYSTAEARVPVASFITAVNVLEREENNGNPAPASLAAARTSVALAVDRLLTMGMSRGQMEEIRRSRVGTTTVKITAPVESFVLARTGSAGQRFDAGTELFQLADLRRVWILADVPVADADYVKPGTVARVTVGGRATGVRARVSREVLPQFDPATQSFKLRLEADNPGFVLRPEMFVDVDFEVPYHAAMLVPIDAVAGSGANTHVFVERSPGVFEPRAVETGRRHGGRVTVVRGLQPGERIALSGTFFLDSDSQVTGQVTGEAKSGQAKSGQTKSHDHSHH